MSDGISGEVSGEMSGEERRAEPKEFDITEYTRGHDGQYVTIATYEKEQAMLSIMSIFP